MARPRSEAGRPVTSCPSMAMLPPLTVSRPAMMRSRVDLPQPDGPTKTTNSPSATLRSTAWITVIDPKVFLMPLSVSSAIVASLANSSRSFHPRIGDAGGDEALQENKHQRDGGERHHRHRQQVMPLRLPL